MDNKKFSLEEMVSKINEEIEKIENKEKEIQFNQEQSEDVVLADYVHRKAMSNFNPSFDVRSFICTLEEKIKEVNDLIEKAKIQLNDDNERLLEEKLKIVASDEFDEKLDELID